MALRGQFLRRILGGGIITRSLEGRKSFPRLQSTLTSPRLFIDGVSPSITDEKIKQAFAPFGNLVEAKVLRDRVSGRPKGFAVVTYNTIEEADKACKQMNCKRLGGSLLIVQPRDLKPPKQEVAREPPKQEVAREPPKQEYACPKRGCSVYIHLTNVAECEGLSSMMTIDKLKEAFAPFGDIVEARISGDPRYKRFAIVKYDTVEAAEQACKALDDKNMISYIY